MNTNNFEPISFEESTLEQLFQNIENFGEIIKNRRSVRDFSDKNVPKEIIENILKIANNAPSGANKQPWHFVAVSNIDIKKKIRIAAEKEEFESYNGRMPQDWLNDLKKFGTNWQKPFLETAPWLIIVFKKSYNLETNSQTTKNYYVNESVGIACGMLITAIHMAGLVTLTHTPSPMSFLQSILERPVNEKPFLLLPVGFPAENAMVPVLTKKDISQTATFI